MKPQELLAIEYQWRTGVAETLRFVKCGNGNVKVLSPRRIPPLRRDGRSKDVATVKPVTPRRSLTALDIQAELWEQIKAERVAKV